MGIISGGVGDGIFSTASAGGNVAPGQSSDTLGKEDFTRLLITQIQNQDPLRPMSSTEFVAQLTQFSSLEQLSVANSNLEQLRFYQNSISRLQAASLLGREIAAEGNTIFLSPHASAQLNYRLRGDASVTRLYIYDNRFELVKTIQLNAQPAGEHSVTWDGRDSRGTERPPGNYSFIVEALDALGNHVPADTFTRGEVTGLSYQGGTINMVLGELEIPLESLIRVDRSGRGSTENP